MWVEYWWMGFAKQDFTVKIHSKQDLTVYDFDDETNEIHMDGQLPSGFTNSDYRI